MFKGRVAQEIPRKMAKLWVVPWLKIDIKNNIPSEVEVTSRPHLKKRHCSLFKSPKPNPVDGAQIQEPWWEGEVIEMARGFINFRKTVHSYFSRIIHPYKKK